MGHEVWKALGKETYTLAFVAAEGQAGTPWREPWKLGPVQPGSLEGLLVAAGHTNAVVDFRRLDASGAWLRQKLTSRPLGHSDMTADWTNVFDGVVFTRTMFPSTLAKRVKD
jgi:erythromycin esterase-like protein